MTGNVFVNGIGDEKVHRNRAPNNTESNNDGTSPTTIANAGIREVYQDIKDFTIPTTGITPSPRMTRQIVPSRNGSASSYGVYSLSGRFLGSMGSLSQQTEKQIRATGICLIRRENTSGGTYGRGMRKVLIQK